MFVVVLLHLPYGVVLIRNFLSSAPALSTRNLHKSAMQSSDDASMRSPWKAYGSGEQSPKPDFDDSPNYGIAAPLLKSIMTQVQE